MKIKYALRPDRNHSGFTLVELMVSFSVLAIVTLIIGSAFRLGINAWHKGEEETGYTQRVRVLSAMLSQQIKSAFPYKGEVDSEKVVIFKGEEDSILFVTTLTDSSSGGFKWIRYSLRDGTLFYKEGLLPDKEFEDKLTGDEEILDPEAGEMKLSYYNKDDEDWVDSWDFDKTLPRAVKIEIPYFPPISIYLPMGDAGGKGKDKDAD